MDTVDSVDEIQKKIIENLVKVRKKRGMSRPAFYEPLGLNSSYMGVIERGEQAITLPKLILICKAHLIPIEQLVEIRDKPTDNLELRHELYSLIDECDNEQKLKAILNLIKTVIYCI